jgi:isoleucyl-tRNA synthetase
MPYAYIHYPFENRELFEKNFPGHFVAEGLDQTRGWSVSLFSHVWFVKGLFTTSIVNCFEVMLPLHFWEFYFRFKFKPGPT